MEVVRMAPGNFQMFRMENHCQSEAGQSHASAVPLEKLATQERQRERGQTDRPAPGVWWGRGSYSPMSAGRLNSYQTKVHEASLQRSDFLFKDEEGGGTSSKAGLGSRHQLQSWLTLTFISLRFLP